MKSSSALFKVGRKILMLLLTFIFSISAFYYISFCLFTKPPVNPEIKKDAQKVVDSFTAEEFKAKTAFCRCWRSANFPYCDGSHNAYNKECCDNVGPLVISKRR
nr:EOG090X0JRY [Artemia franciscana]